MAQWSPQQVFICTYVAAALAGLSGLLRSPQPLTARAIIGTVLFYGCAGTGLGMVGYEYLGGRENPWRVIGCGMLVGVRLIQFQQIKNIVARILNDPPSNHSNNKNKDDKP